MKAPRHSLLLSFNHIEVFSFLFCCCLLMNRSFHLQSDVCAWKTKSCHSHVVCNVCYLKCCPAWDITDGQIWFLIEEAVQEEKHFPRLPVLEINVLFPVRMPKIILQTIGSGFLAYINWWFWDLGGYRRHFWTVFGWKVLKKILWEKKKWPQIAVKHWAKICYKAEGADSGDNSL